MGGICGKSPLLLRYELASEPLKAFFDSLEINRNQGLQLYKIFETIDVDQSRSIGLEEFFDHFNLDFTTFAENAFKMMDVDRGLGSNLTLDFPEFFVGIWNYCTMNHEFLVKFAFDLFDHDGGGTIDKHEIHQMICMVFGKRKPNKQVNDLLKKMDKDNSGEVSLLEWRDMNRRAASLLMPAHDLQMKLRERVCGKVYWDKATRARLGRMGKKDLIEHYFYLRTGTRLDRKTVAEQAVMQKQGIVSLDIPDGIDVYEESNAESKKLRKLTPGETLVVYEERPDETTSDMWFLIAPDKNEWVQSEYIKLDATWLKHDAAIRRGKQREQDEKDERKSRMEENASKLKKLQQTWVESRDPKTKRKYWYNVNDNETTWKNPFKHLQQELKKAKQEDEADLKKAKQEEERQRLIQMRQDQDTLS